MIKPEIPSEFFLDWFFNSLLPPISKGITMMGATKEEEVIFEAQ